MHALRFLFLAPLFSTLIPVAGAGAEEAATTAPLVLTASASSTAFADLSASQTIDGNASTFWSSASHGKNAVATEWLQIDFDRTIRLAGIALKPRVGGYGWPRAFHFEYSYDAAGLRWFPVPTRTYTNQSTRTAPVTYSFDNQVLLARRMRIVATELSADNYGNFYFQLAEVAPIEGTGYVFPFETDKGEAYNAQLNMMWTIYGSTNDGSNANFKTGSIFTTPPAWHEWLALKYAWSATTKQILSDIYNGEIVNWSQSEDGYIWSWDKKEKWPTGDGSYHQENNAKYILGMWRVWCWNRDDSFFDKTDATTATANPRPDVSMGRTQREKLREAMRYIEESLQGSKGGIQIEDNGMGNTGKADGEPTNYWDNWPLGYLNAYDNIYYYAALEAMAQMEEHWGNLARAAQLRKYRDGCKAAYHQTFWNTTTGRFIACQDVDGKRWDFGGTFHNLEALAYGLGDEAKAKSVFDWLDGKRVVAGDTSAGADIYRWGFAPRANTLKIESDGPPYWWFTLNGAIKVNTNARWDVHLENGGAIFYTSYYDLMARLKWLGADAALARWNAIVAEFEKDQLRRRTGEPAWQLGIIGEFPESGLVPAFLVHGFAGINADAAGLHIRPNLPSSWDHLTVRQVAYAGCLLDITVRKTSVEMRNLTQSPRAVYVGKEPIEPGKTHTATITNGGELTVLPKGTSQADTWKGYK